MSQFERILFGGLKKPTEGPFPPFAWYYARMDMLLYIKEDCTYLSERVDPYLSVFVRPEDGRLVGFKLKGFQCLFNQLKPHPRLRNLDFSFVVALLEMALGKGLDGDVIQELRAGKVNDVLQRLLRYQAVRKLLSGWTGKVNVEEGELLYS